MNKRLLIIGFVWPEPKSSAAGSRMMQLISYFKARQFDITFVSASVKTENSVDLQDYDITTAMIKLNCSSFDEFVTELQPGIVLFDRFMTEEQFGWRISTNCPKAIKILDTEDLHFLRRARQQVIKSVEDTSPIDLLNDTTKREIASIYRCDLSLIISEFEMKLLTESFEINPRLLQYLPFLVDEVDNTVQKSHASYDSRDHFMTIGNFIHEPNMDALRYLKQTIWPEIRKMLPNAELHNYGAYASEKVTQLHNAKEGFLIKGFAENVNEVMQQAKVLLVPVRFGAGLKGKIFDAMNNGLPFISTSIGLEGIIDSSHNNELFCDQSEDFVAAAITLYSDKAKWLSQQLQGYTILNSKFSKPRFEQLFDERLQILFAEYERERQLNFIGQMLQHHSLQSTKYMSKWIEAKNQAKKT